MRLSRCGLATVVLVLSACEGCGGGLAANRHVDAGGVDAGNRLVRTISATLNRNIDILFMIDDSSAMRLAQDNLRASFPTFLTRLMSPPGLPNIHLAVVSQDMGAGDGSISGCNATGGKKGIFQYTGGIIPPAVTPCATHLNAGATFIANVGGVANYTGEMAEVFSCIAALGETGCGFEHQFAAILRALGADGAGAAPAEDQGFLRPDAYLMVVMLTNEDDCSADQGIPLFDVSQNTNLLSQLGPPANFRCNEFGHTCDGASPQRQAPGNDVATTVTYNSCASNDSNGYLLSPSDVASRLKVLKADPSQVMVASIQAPTTPYTVHWRNPSTADTSCGVASCPWPEISHSCTAADGSFGDPGVRTAEFVEQFGANGLLLPICSDNLAPSLDRIAQMINDRLGPPCLQGTIADEPGKPGTPDCDVTMFYAKGDGTFGEKAVKPCSETAGAGPCWQLQPGSSCQGQLVMLTPDPTLASGPTPTSGSIARSARPTTRRQLAGRRSDQGSALKASCKYAEAERRDMIAWPSSARRARSSGRASRSTQRSTSSA